METIRRHLAASSHKGVVNRKAVKFNRPNRVTREMVMAARAAVQRANEGAQKARLGSGTTHR